MERLSTPKELEGLIMSAHGISENIAVVKRGRGRPKDPNALQFHTLGLTQAQWEWLALWFPEGNRTAQLQELLERSRKFWPAGPAKFR